MRCPDYGVVKRQLESCDIQWHVVRLIGFATHCLFYRTILRCRVFALRVCAWYQVPLHHAFQRTMFTRCCCLTLLRYVSLLVVYCCGTKVNGCRVSEAAHRDISDGCVTSFGALIAIK